MTNALALRVIEPELLDMLPAQDPRAMHARRDLVWVNALMLQSLIMTRLIRRHLAPGRLRLLEVGAGDGAFMLAVAQRLRERHGDVDIVMLDQHDLVTDERRAGFAQFGWRVHTVTADIFDWLEEPGGAFDAVTANLFLHHFDDAALRRLFASLAEISPVLIATEPHRNLAALWATALLRAVGVNDVTRHDAAASVRGGFRAGELSVLWPGGASTRFEERRIGPFTHGFVARAVQEDDLAL